MTSTVFCMFINLDSIIWSLCTISCTYWFKRYRSDGSIFVQIAPTNVLWLALVSRPSGKNNFKVATMQPWVSFRAFSMTSTPNWTISPELTSNGSDSVVVWLRRWLLIKVPLLLPVSLRKNLPSLYHRTAWFRDNTLQSKMAFVSETLFRATERPIFTSTFGSKYNVRF